MTRAKTAIPQFLVFFASIGCVMGQTQIPQFSLPTYYPVSGTGSLGPFVFTGTADFNGDGLTDIITFAPGSTNVSVLLGEGSGKFGDHLDSYVGAQGGYAPSAVIADFNGDGKLDLAVTSVSGVRVLAGDGTGHFTLIATPNNTSCAQEVAGGDLNRDGKIDLVVDCPLGSTVSVFLGRGDGTFTSPTQFDKGLTSETEAVRSLIVADFNNDGVPDVIVTAGTVPSVGSITGQISLLLGTGNGALSSPNVVRSQMFVEFLVAADVNRDGNMDLVYDYLDATGEHIDVQLGDGTGSFKAPARVLSTDGTGQLRVADIDGDGFPDIAVQGILTTSPTIQSWAVLLGLGDGSFVSALTVGVQGACTQPCRYPSQDFNLEDVNGDRKADLLFGGSGTLAVALNITGSAPALAAVSNAASNLSGSISPGEIVVIFGTGLGPTKLTAASVGSDGLFDPQLAGTTVQFNGTPSPMIYTSATQVAAVVPYSISGSAAQVTVTYQGQTSSALSVPVASSAPGVFTLNSTGTGQAAVVNQDGSINTAATTAKIGDIISAFVTGEGQTSPSGVDGKPATVPYPQPILPVSVAIGGQKISHLEYAGGAPGEVAGVMQINVQIPMGIQPGTAVPITVQVGNVSTQTGVTIAVAGN
jgi:uncharacterized protein (TIGR03437 family)